MREKVCFAINGEANIKAPSFHSRTTGDFLSGSISAF